MRYYYWYCTCHRVHGSKMFETYGKAMSAAERNFRESKVHNKTGCFYRIRSTKFAHYMRY